MSSVVTFLTLAVLATAHSGVEHRVVLCVSSIASRHFVPGQPLVISAPGSDHVADRAPVLRRTEAQLMDAAFSSLHGQSKWPIVTSRSDAPAVSGDAAHKHQSYVIFLWPEHRNDATDTLRQSMDSLLLYTNSFNHRAKFLLVPVGYKQPFSQSDILKLLEIMWNPHKITNVLIMLPTAAAATLNDGCSNCEYGVLSLYTWFPYDFNVCGEVKQLVLLDQWLPEGEGRFGSNAELFPSEVPRNLHGCPLTIAPMERTPFVKLTNSYTDSSGNVTYLYEGLEIEYILFPARAMNFTPVFMEPRVGDFVQVRVEVFMEIAQGLVDVTVGTHPIHPLLVTAGDATRPYYEITMRWWVPCAAPATRTDKVMAVFTLSVWVSIVLVFILTAAAF